MHLGGWEGGEKERKREGLGLCEKCRREDGSRME